jgi:tetratricopeptide (TPR) repeat protein
LLVQIKVYEKLQNNESPAMSELRLGDWRMPAAPLGQKNPLPPLAGGRDLHAIEAAPDIPPEMLRHIAYGHLPNILPYTLQDGYTRHREPQVFKTAVLENNILRATFLLELGGRLWSLFHKPSGRELLAVNPVFQPANLALRNAWFSGGVEWNIGTIGHSPFTCAPLFAAKVEGPDGTPILRLYEYERFRGVPFQLDITLPDDSPVLLVRVAITNPHAHEIPMYWWSNIAVPESAQTRVIMPAHHAYHFGYQGSLSLIPTPVYEEEDYTYATNIDRSADYFFKISEGKRPFIAALDHEGKGLVQTSTTRLQGRKLFLWGMGAGGRQWQKFLSPPGCDYIEIQAGLARTQLEHLPMPGQTTWAWLEAYGLMEADPAIVHGENWDAAETAVAHHLESLIPTAALEAEFARSAAFANQPPVELWQLGSGWGALERIRRQQAGEPPLSAAGLPFPDDSLTAEQQPWLDLLRRRQFSPSPPETAPAGLMVQKEWRDMLETAVQTPQSTNWLAWYHLGVMRHYAGEQENASHAWRQSLDKAATPWALRNLAAAAQADGRLEEAAALIVKAQASAPDLLPLAVECGQILIAARRGGEWLDIFAALSPEIRAVGRIRLLEAQAALQAGDLSRVAQFFADNVVVDDIREGEVSLSDLWFAYHVQQVSQQENLPVNAHLKTRIRQEYPLPAAFDFRMVKEGV